MFLITLLSHLFLQFIKILQIYKYFYEDYKNDFLIKVFLIKDYKNRRRYKYKVCKNILHEIIHYE